MHLMYQLESEVVEKSCIFANRLFHFILFTVKWPHPVSIHLLA